MPAILSKKPYRIGRSRTGLGLFATKRIKKGTKIIRYFGPLLDSKKKKDDAIENKYLFELNNRWTIDGSVRENVARYINHACRPNAESDVRPRKRKVFIRAIKNIEPGEEISYDYGTDYFKAYLKPIGCKCDACAKKRKRKRAEAKAERLRLKAKMERKAKKLAEEKAAKRAKDRLRAKARERINERSGIGGELRPDRKRKLDSKSRAPIVRLKTASRPVKRNVANGRHLNANVPSPAASVAASEVSANPQATAAFAASKPAIPSTPIGEAQQASA